MKDEVVRHRVAYVLLLTGMIFFVLAFMAVWPSREGQRILATMMGGYYVVWGSLTHVKTKHFTSRVLGEYLGVAVLGVLALVFITL
jgi:hypothetical protein